MEIIDVKKLDNNDVTKQPLFTGGQVHTQLVLEEQLCQGKVQIVNVKFARGARNKLHTHTATQVLYVTEGKGIVADRKKEYTLTPGMAVIIHAGEEHWHGAAKDSSFAHLSIIGQPQEMKILE